MDSLKAFKYVSMIILSFLLVGNVVLFFSNNSEEEETSLNEEQIQELQGLREENEHLRYLDEYDSTTARERLFHELEEQAERFLHSIFEQNADNYQTQKDEAEEVMNDEMIDRFFPADLYGEHEVETEIDEANYYIENMEENRDEIDIVIEITHQIKYLKSGMEEESHAFIRATFERQGDHWIATSFKDMM